MLLADEAGKAMQSDSRARLNQVVGAATVTTQWGSRLHGGATDDVHRFVDACFILATKRNLRCKDCICHGSEVLVPGSRGTRPRPQ